MAVLIRCKCKAEAKLGTKKCPGCGELYPKKGRRYKVVVRCNGRKKTRTVGNLDTARIIEAALKVEIAKGELGIQEKKPAPKLSKVWDKYLPWAMEHKKSWNTDLYYYQKHLEPAFGSRPMDDISHFDIEKLVLSLKRSKNKRGKPYAPATIKHQIVLLSRLYTFAEQWDMYEGTNPCKRVKKPRLNNQKTEYLSDNELTRLLDTLDGWHDKIVSGLIRFALLTGLRRGELFSLRWEDIDFDHQQVFLINPKGGVDQTLPLSDEAIAVLKDLPRANKSKWIFYGKNGQQRTDVKKAWAAIRQHARLPYDFRFHGLRHHFASALASAGYDLYTIQRLLTHKDPTTTQRYAHLTDKRLRDAVSYSGSLLNSNNDESELIIPFGDKRNGEEKESGKTTAEDKSEDVGMWGMVKKILE